MAEYLTTDTELNAIADAINTKGGTSGQLIYPSGFVSAIQAIPTGTTPTGTINISANGTYDVTNYASAAVAIPEYAGAHHSVVTGYTVTVSLTNPISSGYFSSCTIYERLTGGAKGNQIGSISSASGSTTVSVDPSAYGLWIDLRGGYISPPADATMTGGVSGYDWNDGNQAYVTVNVSGDGTLTLKGIDWDD